ncbi:DMT family transporter [Asticcacaulis sp. BYS171W]|uniref:DMT family transporter n=1 Tax=Asticcacaulis aquaticus TaxID=2984212 RepID=A0ABT5HPL2_9CAUL|nr:DMT family transporter [Asticcacaulis aquaticus]MDC7681924.1 DMT family transporter [Asticcacaulis aquaticus]
MTRTLQTAILKWGGYALAFAGSFLFATKGIFIKLAYEYHVDATTLLMLRLLIATPFFVVIGLITHYRQRGREPLPLMIYMKALGVGVLGYWFASYTDFEGLVHLTPQFERLILFTYPLFVILFGAAFFGQKLKPLALPAFGIAYAGLAFVFVSDMGEHGHDIAIGTAWVMTSSVAFALYLLLAKPVIARMGPSLFTSVAMVGAALATFVHFGTTHPLSAVPLSPGLLWLCLGLAIGATVLPGYLINFALARISSQANAVIGFVNPVFTLMMSAFILHETISASDVIGTALVLGGVGLYMWLDQRPSKPAVSSAG